MTNEPTLDLGRDGLKDLNPVNALLPVNWMDPKLYGLPHREPFIFIESVDQLEKGVFALCSKSFSAEEPFFKGHFPGNAIVPGVLLTEGMAQTAGIAAGGPGKSYLLTAIRSMKFLRPVRPGESIVFEARKVGDAGGLVQCAVLARIGKETVCEGQIILAESVVQQPE
jgi:3-hydroxyacyl-[acyl-carrier-protein] dehydratase